MGGPWRDEVPERSRPQILIQSVRPDLEWHSDEANVWVHLDGAAVSRNATSSPWYRMARSPRSAAGCVSDPDSFTTELFSCGAAVLCSLAASGRGTTGWERYARPGRQSFRFSPPPATAPRVYSLVGDRPPVPWRAIRG